MTSVCNQNGMEWKVLELTETGIGNPFIRFFFVADGELEMEVVKAVFPNCRKICCIEPNAYFASKLKAKAFPNVQVTGFFVMFISYR